MVPGNQGQVPPPLPRPFQETRTGDQFHPETHEKSKILRVIRASSRANASTASQIWSALFWGYFEGEAKRSDTPNALQNCRPPFAQVFRSGCWCTGI